ncbi:hypothetical protein [Rhizobium sp. NFR03]|uniref:hypothetical protein n=1 Tax=Rhizobium sp. NFR03 TaxID=1566263 RepID=UPI0008AFEADF|nr:hypothetical protein [Rhizobium sp. NFR03]SES28323.1 hypothetical protein SAMN03159406_03238 [Rhizobium sp. NFR03]
MTALYDIITWTRENGEVMAESRLRMRTLPFTAREGLAFASIGPSTHASEELVVVMRKEASAVVGMPCPY